MAEPVSGNAQDHFIKAANLNKSGTRSDEIKFLQDLLKGGKLPAKEVERLADEAGFEWKTVNRAKEAAGVEWKRERYQGVVYWNLR